EMVEGAHDAIAWRRELQNHETRTARQHAIHFAERAVEIVHIANTEGDDRPRRRVPGEGQIHCIRYQRRYGGGDFLAAGAQHWFGEIGAKHTSREAGLTGERRRDIQRPSAEIDVRRRWRKLPP